ncbi:heme lyase NrfEFG subunit NrfE [Rhodothalassium salexigens]|uniref:heme lyase CcmF/NrfE family subunit n=1 Tax=Rhodothalassium salexigens TaxID=1086 RepID=UPI001911ACC1|nr:heme lyase NrfEFG subunit NrfE [Rhodothalassium salexigens]MBK5921724.1 heme lyase NrfEFG subunit NrfE [Rhodothalassium salexigens]
MSPELGHLSLWLAFGLAAIVAVVPLIGAHRGDARLMAVAEPLAVGQFLFVALAFAALTQAFIVSDFSVRLVVASSHTDKPLLYKISGVWGNHEGSLLLWMVILTLFAAAVAAFGRNLPASFRARVLSVQSMIATGFLAFILFTSNPFERLIPAPPQGQGLNPLLQDPGLAFHPPLLYLGYVGFSIAFSFAVAALIDGRIGPTWARWVRPWTLAAWMALTAGIALGSWWAYYELGWGGWWFWDPVENASLMPWLAGTALLHSAIVVEKRDALKSWTILLAIMTFSLSLLGTFLVRSGVLTSVHAFATDPARGVFILALLALTVGGALTLYAWRSASLEASGLYRPVSREGMLVVNNLFLAVSAATVLLGTLYPLIVDGLLGEKITVAAPFFNTITVALAPGFLLAMAIGPLMAWKRGSLKSVVKDLRPAIVGTALFAVFTLVALDGEWAPLMGLVLGVWLVLATAMELAKRIKLFSTPPWVSLRRLVGLPKRQWGLTLGHLGLAVTILGIAGSEAFTVERLVTVSRGESVEAGPYTFIFEGVNPAAGPNYTAVEGHFRVQRGQRTVARLTPEERTYTSPPNTTTEAAIRTLWHGDLYAVVGEPEQGGWSARLYYKPLVSWIWFGAGLMVVGGAISLTDRRRRVGAPTRAKADRADASAGSKPVAAPAE